MRQSDANAFIQDKWETQDVYKSALKVMMDHTARVASRNAKHAIIPNAKSVVAVNVTIVKTVANVTTKLFTVTIYKSQQIVPRMNVPCATVANGEHVLERTKLSTKRVPNR